MPCDTPLIPSPLTNPRHLKVGALDDAVKNITAALQSKGLLDDTLLIFTTGALMAGLSVSSLWI